MGKILCLLFMSLLSTMIGFGTPVATIETPEPPSFMKITGIMVTPNNQPAYLWMDLIKSKMMV